MTSSTRSLAARIVRTIYAAAAAWLLVNGVLIAVLQALGVGDVHAAFRIFVIGGASALLAGVAVAITTGIVGWAPTTPWGKAVKQAAEMFAAGIVVLGLADVTVDAAINWTTAIVRLALTCLAGALGTFQLNKVDPAPMLPPPASPAA